MSRNLTAAALSALASTEVQIGYFIKLGLDSGVFAVSNLVADYTIGGVAYTGLGNLVSISGFNENGSLRQDQITATLHYSDSSLIAAVNATRFRNKEFVLTLGLFDKDWQLIHSATQWEGQSEYAEIVQGNQQGDNITVYGTRFWFDWDRRSDVLYTNESQHQIDSGDNIFEFVPSVADQSGSASFAGHKLIANRTTLVNENFSGGA